jgi:hypothetical protein
VQSRLSRTDQSEQAEDLTRSNLQDKIRQGHLVADDLEIPDRQIAISGMPSIESS